MLRFINITLLLGLVALAYVIYEVKYEARGLDRDIADLNRQIDDERDSIGVLRAEWSLLNRPERIERLAKKFLNLRPADPRQILTLDNASKAEFEQKVATVAPEKQPGESYPSETQGYDVPAYVKLLQDTAPATYGGDR